MLGQLFRRIALHRKPVVKGQLEACRDVSGTGVAQLRFKELPNRLRIWYRSLELPTRTIRLPEFHSRRHGDTFLRTGDGAHGPEQSESVACLKHANREGLNRHDLLSSSLFPQPDQRLPEHALGRK